MNLLSSTLFIMLVSAGLCLNPQRAILSRITPYTSWTGNVPKDTVKKKQPTSLFKSEEILQMTLRANLTATIKDRGDNPTYHAATLTYYDKNKQPVTAPLRIKVRGNFRRNRANCSFPPLMLNFQKKIPGKNLFDKQNTLKLVTHCQTESYVVREYLVYKLFNLFTKYSFKARLAKVTYEDSLGKRSPETRFAFLLEDDQFLARRNGATILEKKQINMARADAKSMARVAVFEYMIGNTDWSMPYLHNIRLFTDATHKQPIPVPYDFDHSGIVEASYARPAEQLEISTVRDRLYRGYYYEPELFQEVFDEFNKLKPKVYAIYENNPHLDASYIKRTLKYLDQFYEQINKPNLVKNLFLTQGKKNQNSNIVIKGLQ